MSDDFKSVFNPDKERTDTYFGGQGEPDGPGHGHVRVDGEGNDLSIRDSYEPGVPNARRDATLLEYEPDN